MTVNNVFNNLGARTALDYGMYKSAKGEDSDFVDFLLSYDAKGAEDGDDSWLSKVGSSNNDKLLSLTSEAMNKLGKDFPVSDVIKMQSTDYFSSQVSSLKNQLFDGFKTRIENSSESEAVKSAKVTALYEKMQSADMPSRFKD